MDDRDKRDGRDRSRIAAGQDYEAGYFAEQAGISVDQARELIQRHGNNRQKLMDEAKLIRGT